MTTDILSLSEITENQSAKYLTHNEAIRQIEAMLVRVLSRSNGGPPASPSAGDVYIVDSAVDAWSEASVDDIAYYYAGGWHFYTPITGIAIPCVDENTMIRYTGADWQTLTVSAGLSDFDENSATTSGLTWGYTAGVLRSASSVISVSAGTVTLTDDATNYVEIDDTGTVSANTSGFTSGSVPLRTVVTSSGSQTSSTDKRAWLIFPDVGTLGSQDADSVNITGGSISGITDLAIADGGTGASSASAARTNLSLDNVPNEDATDPANWNPAKTDGNFLVGDGSTFVAESGATARASMGVGTLGTQAADSVAITGGNATGLTRVGFNSEYDNGTISSNTDVDWSNGQNQKVTLGADVTLTFSNMGVGHKQLRVVQDGTGSRTPTLPSGLWPGGSADTFSTAADAVDILSIYYDGSSYYYQLTKGWA